MPLCSICGHPRRAEIDLALVEGGTVRDTARRFSVGRNAVQRHRKGGHIIETLAKAHEVAKVAMGDALLLRVHDLEVNALRILRRAERAGDLTTALKAIRELRSMLALLFETERRRKADSGISGEELTVLVTGLIDIIRRHVPDRETRARMADEIRRLTGGGIEGDGA